ncbi:hypothetical protein TWF569_004073 [Orbilia oligospora]|uniref:Uncharacterized protein n=1 Tax=Orbilia oligospora TaxID=2813651 RepID=A0A7C8NQE8_ORBOL|nr:hypothetical protein TWF102_005079 [Orbilia oligospora]KAF3141016.1 hypothetical protein TWF703_002523 [Orbilia oligospora]KAF3157171.1 hypothetical protein TWF569_004073 [Orbilia oligospora]
MGLEILIPGSRKKKYYNPPYDFPEHLRCGVQIIYLLETYRSDPRPTGLEHFYYSIHPKSLPIELRRHDMAGIIVEYSRPPPEDPRPKVYLIEDEFDASVLGDPFEMKYTAVYPESYKGLVPYYVGCESLESGEFDRPLKDRGLEVGGGFGDCSGISSQVNYKHGWSEPRRRKVRTEGRLN